VNKPCLFPADANSGGCDEPCEPVRVVLLDDLKVLLKEAEKELNGIVAGHMRELYEVGPACWSG